jgi:hypothetical protein
MPSFTEEAYLREKVRFLSAGLLSRLREFVEEFPSGQSGRKLIRTIEQFLEQIDLEVAKTSEPKVLRWYCPLIDELSEYLEAFDHAHTAHTPRACVSVLNEISRNLLEDAEILVTPAVESNYRIFDEVPRLSSLTSLLPEAAQESVLRSLPEALYRVRFPRIERENILNHALFGHEFGHPIAYDFFETHETKSAYQARLTASQKELELEESIAAEVARSEGDVEKARITNAISDRLSQIHKRALVELVSDAVAIYLFGPSALFAALDLFIREGLDERPEHEEYYPPTRYRWRFMLDVLRTEGHIRALQELKLTRRHSKVRQALTSTMTFLKRTTATESDRKVLNVDPYTRVAYAWLEETLPEAITFARARCLPMIYDASLINSQVPGLLERLKEGVPPSEIGTWPSVQLVDWRSTFVASWLTALSHSLDESLSASERSKLLRTTHALAAKGVESIHLKREYSAFKAANHNGDPG